jgi:hypothetical protein
LLPVSHWASATYHARGIVWFHWGGGAVTVSVSIKAPTRLPSKALP